MSAVQMLTGTHFWITQKRIKSFTRQKGNWDLKIFMTLYKSEKAAQYDSIRWSTINPPAINSF